MIDDLIRQLHSPDPAERRAAIIALANTKDPAALKPLSEVYRDDPDPALRELALKAGRYIQQKASADSPPPPGGSSDEPPVSERDAELAKGYLEAALGHYRAGDKARTAENLGKALSLNPALRAQSFVQNLVTILTGLPFDQGIGILIHPDRRNAFIKTLGGKPSLQRAPGDDAPWINVLIDLALYWLVNAIGSIALFGFGMFEFMQRVYERLPASTTSPGSLTAADLDTLANASLVALIPAALVSSFFNVIGLLFQAVVLHGVATMILSGEGTLTGLLRKLVPLLTVFSLISSVLIGGVLITGSDSLIMTALPTVSILGAIAILVLMAVRIGQAYRFGPLNGCATMVIAIVVMVALSICLWCLLIPSLTNMSLRFG
ncbi:MAG: HEAT repeat domain-containing protein [Anaerolineae bacterium]|nr:HEAT repeat domain-containing protein [Anaerolineae bacterium]